MKTPTTAGRRSDLGGRPVIALATEDDQHAEVRHAAEAHARAHGCSLILFAADVASAWSEPLPNQWASEGEAEGFGQRLSENDLESLGRSAIAAQVRDSRRAGVRASAWLPKDKGVKALAEYAAAQDAHIVFVPASLDSLDELGSLLATAAEDKRAGPGIEVQVVRQPDAAAPESAAGDTGS